MNLGVNKEEAKFLRDVIHLHLEKTSMPALLIDTYKMLGVDIPDMLAQLSIIAEIGEEPITEKERSVFKNGKI